MTSVGIISYLSLLQYRENAQRVTHTREVLEKTKEVMSQIKDAETGQRGYLLTGKERYLEPYRTATGQIAQKLQALRQLTADNPNQQRQLDRLEPLISKKLVLIEQTINARSKNLESALQIIQTDRGQQIMEDIRMLTRDMENEEKELLKQRSMEANASAHQTTLLTIFGSIIASAIIGLAATITNQELVKRKLMENYLQNARDELEIEISKRTAELRNTNEELQTEINERKKAESEILRLNVQLEQRVAERTAQLEATNKEMEAFSYSVSHDLRAPLRSIDGFSQALLEDYADKLDALGQNYLQRVRAATQRMAQLIDDLLNLSRLTRSEMRYEKVDLSALVEAIATELHKTQPERQVEFVIAPGLVANGDAHLLRIVLENLLGNAWKFTGKHQKARIEFGLLLQDNTDVYFVRDDGTGFDMAYVEKLFGAFQRLHAMTEFEGTGIGLATVQRIIHRHGGRVWAESAVEQGATFYFTL
ncbi:MULTISPECIES: sensor histidine kinase [unclassified Nostoc]|uniref:sensor histidine kinase n=1 Tax=unclassified Nostoc TaxID=2593658 RepID=UPI0025AB04DF|nr:MULTISPECIES: sensor histidine kinase [unclassified Nostoc]MDM9581671.1 CHASE3 domain-containing protein [Nostoc sp. GT001]MDZ7947077.1 CHASE3 domain-containing protein [Nostoc sp. EfeVER01]MDZ7991502.1 CHASE3 domain-containing protein [Nostoc sp. EspVER01]